MGSSTVSIILNSATIQTALGGIIAALFSFWFGFWLYKKQRTSEAINKYYFQDGIVGFSDYLNIIRVATEENYTNGLLVLKYFRDLSNERFEEWYEDFRRSYKPVFTSPVMPACFFRVGFLLDNDPLQNTCLDIFIIASRNNEYLISEVPRQIRAYQANPASMPKDAFVDKLESRIHDLFKEVGKEKLYHVVDALNEVLYRLNEMNITAMAQLKTIKDDAGIKKILHDLEQVNLTNSSPANTSGNTT